ncbi:MAG: hypothetical protein ACRCT8_10395 [Lacipirellulaceae bacterium]
MSSFRRNSIRSRATSVALVAVYALLAIAGESLHALSHAGDRASGAATACSCGFHAAAKLSSAEGPAEGAVAFRSADDASGHDPATCSVCSLLAKFKVGEGAETPPSLFSEGIAPAASPVVAIATLRLTRVVDARGPPSRV